MSSNEGQDIEMLELGWATLGLPILHPCSLGLEFPTSAPFCTHHLSLGTPGHAVPLMCSFLIFSICVTRRENLYMLVSMANTDIDYCPKISTSKCTETQYLLSPGTRRIKAQHTIQTKLFSMSLMNTLRSRIECDERADFSPECIFPKTKHPFDNEARLKK